MRIWFSLAATVLSAGWCHAQVVQLPSVGTFGTSTTISVPDQGTGSLGGTSRSAYGTTSRGAGPLATRAHGGHSGVTSSSITATIIDLAAMDEAITNAPADSKGVKNFTAPRQGTKIVNTLTPHHYDRDIRQRTVAPQPYDWMRALGPEGTAQLDSAENKVRDGSNTRYFLDRAAEAEAHGRSLAAKVYFQMALERMTPAQRQRFDEIRASRAVAATDATKKDPSATKTPESGQSAPATATPSDNSAASPFDAPADPASANTDMNSAPF